MMEVGRNAESDQQHANDDACADIYTDQAAQQGETEENDKRAGDRGKQGTILSQEPADRAGRSAETNKDNGETKYEREGRGEQARFRLFTLAKLLNTDAGEHGNVAGNERKHTWGQEGDESSKECPGQRNVSHFKGV